MHQVKYEYFQRFFCNILIGTNRNSALMFRRAFRPRGLGRAKKVVAAESSKENYASSEIWEVRKRSCWHDFRYTTYVIVCVVVCSVCVRPALSCMVVQSVLSALFFFPSAAQFVLNIICIWLKLAFWTMMLWAYYVAATPDGWHQCLKDKFYCFFVSIVFPQLFTIFTWHTSVSKP